MPLPIDSAPAPTTAPAPAPAKPAAPEVADDTLIGDLAIVIATQSALESKPDPKPEPAKPAATPEQLDQQLAQSRPVATTARPSTGGTWSFAASALVEPPPPAEPPKSEAQQAVDQALEEGGATAAAQELRKQTQDLPPEEASKVLTPEVVESITKQLGEESKSADGSSAAGLTPKQKEYDQAVADLAAAAEKGDEETLRQVAESVVENIDPKNVGRFDEALGNAVGSGSGARLSLAVIQQLSQNGRTKQADDILQNVEDGTNQLRDKADGLADKVEGYNSQLGRLISDWKEVLTPEELQNATQAFRDSHPEYAEQDRLAGALVNTANELSQLPPEVAGLKHADDVSGANEKLISEQLVRLANTDGAVSALAKIQLEHVPGQPDLLAETEKLSLAGKLDDDQKDALASMNVSAAALNAVGGHGRDAFEPLGDLSATFGLAPEDLHDLVGQLGDVVEGRTQTNVVNALGQVTGTTAGLSPRVLHSVRGAGLLAGVIGTYGSIEEAIKDPNFENVAQALSNATGSGAEGVALLNSFRATPLAGTAGVELAGRVAGGVGAALGVYSAVKSLQDGDLPEAGLHAAAAAGGIAILAGGTWTGPGVILALGAAGALYQLGRVRASNVQENKHTEAFLRGAGVSNPDVTYHLRDADDEGRSVGPVLGALAKHLDIEPTKFLDWVSTLSPDQVIDFVHAMHGVDPDKKGNFAVTASNDRQIDPATRDSWDKSPRSLEGLSTWLRVHGYTPPVE